MLYSYDSSEIFEAPPAKRAITSAVYGAHEEFVGLSIELEGAELDACTGLPYLYRLRLPMHVAKALYRELGETIDEIASP